MPIPSDDLRRSIQHTNNGLHDHTRDAPRHALEEPADAALLGAPHRLQEHARHAFPDAPHDALRTARGGRSHILALGGSSSSVALLRVGRVARQ